MLSLRNISKKFGPIQALQQVSLRFATGEIHAIVGENGAGKSTLMKIILGIEQADEGEIDDSPAAGSGQHPPHRPSRAMLHQEVQAINHATVAENVLFEQLATFRRHGKIQWRTIEAEAAKYLQLVGVGVSPNTRMGTLSSAQKRMVQVSRLLASGASVLILDEPTSALTKAETQKLFPILRRLRDQGRTIIFISHKLDEVLQLSDRVSVLRDGRCVGTWFTSDRTADQLIHSMMNRDLRPVQPRPLPEGKGPVVLEAVGIQRKGSVQDIHFSLHRGEILGFYGLIGAGRTDLARILVGADRRDGGTIYVHGKAVPMRSVTESLHQHHLGYTTENRKEEGLFLQWPVQPNLMIGAWSRFVQGLTRRVSRNKERNEAIRLMCRLGLSPSRLCQPVSDLSGGSQQRVCIGAYLAMECEMIILDEPTTGVDVSARQQIYDLVRELVAHGKSIILISSDLQEMFQLANRILVFSDRRIVGEVANLDSPLSDFDHVSAAVGRLLV